MKEVYIESYGCSANQNNSEIMAGLLRSAGYGLTNNFDIADVVIINSCIVKGKTENKIKRRVQDLAGCGKLVVVCGCMPETDARELKKLNPKVLLLGVKHYKEIVGLLMDYYKGKLDDVKAERYLSSGEEDKIGLAKISSNKLIGIVQISEGCLGDCSYCKTRLAKGALYSFDMDDIVKSVESDLKNGAKEIWLTSQDCAIYGIDKYGEPRLVELLSKILGLKHRFKLRLGMMNPWFLHLMLDDLMEIYRDKKMYKFLHVPIQSANYDVLQSMNRGYGIDIIRDIVNRFREEFPEGVFATDIITGYPSESNRAHEHNLEFVYDYRPDVFNLSKFSKHKGTKAWELKELSGDVVSKRASELMECHREGALENKKKFVGKVVKVFVNKALGGRLFEARDENYNIVLVKCGSELLGRSVDVLIKSVGVHHLVGDIVI